MRLVEDPDLEVDELDVRQMRMDPVDRRAQRGVERVDRAVALRRAHVALAFDPDLDRRLALDLAVGALLDDRAPRFEPEERLVAARLAAHQQLEGGVGGLELVAEVLELLDPLDDARGAVLAEIDAGRAGLLLDRAAARELGDQHVAAVADLLGVDVLEGARVGADARRRACRALWAKALLADVRLRRVRRAVQELVDEVRGLRQVREPRRLDAPRCRASAGGRR